MNISKCKHIVFSLAISGLLLAGLFLLLNGAPQIARADSGDLFVKPGGSGTSCSQSDPCDLQAALSTATDGDTIYLAQGTYTGSGGAVVTVTKSITLYGGWDGSPTGSVVRDPNAYPTTLDGEGQRRGVFITGTITPTVDGFIISGGNATDLGGSLFNSDAGGGIYSYAASPMIQNNIIAHNIASTQPDERAMGGGVYAQSDGFIIIQNNHILSNTAGIDTRMSDGGGLFIMGPGRIQANTFEKNGACQDYACNGRGGGIYVGWTDEGLEVVGNRFINNQADAGAGLYLVWSAVRIAGNTLYDNQGWMGAGVYSYYDKGSVIEANTVTSNTASGYGGGIVIYITPSPNRPWVINNVIAHNRASGGSGGFYAWSDWYISSVTFAHNTMMDNGEAIGVGMNMTATLTNNIVVSHTLGITTTDSSANVFADHTLFWHNTGDGIRGTNPVDGDPAFVNPDAGDYHIGPTSAAIDAGVDAGVTTDIDGDSRPIGARVDIGADEFLMPIYLPLVVRTSRFSGP